MHEQQRKCIARGKQSMVGQDGALTASALNSLDTRWSCGTCKPREGQCQLMLETRMIYCDTMKCQRNVSFRIAGASVAGTHNGARNAPPVAP